MAKGKLGRYLFRKVRGRVIPIKISNVSDKIAEASDYSGSKFRKIIAKTDKGEHVGQLTLRIPKKGKSADLIDVRVNKEFRRKGISKNLFARASEFLDRSGFKFLRSDDIQAAAQVKIRANQGRYRAGRKFRNKSRFVADQFGPWGEQSRRVSPKEAIDILKNNRTGRQVKGTTMIGGKYRFRKTSGKVILNKGKK